MNSANAAPARPNEQSSGHDTTFFKALLTEIPEYVYFKDRQSRFLAVSTSLVRAYEQRSAADVIGRSDADFLVAERATQTRQDEQEIIRTGVPIAGKIEQDCRRDGSVRWTVTTKLPLRNDQGEIIGTYGISRDIT